VSAAKSPPMGLNVEPDAKFRPVDPLDGLVGQAAALAAGEVSSRELTERSLARIEASQPTLNAFRVICDEQALADAEAADRRLAAGERAPLLGVPFAIKDDVDLAGHSTPFGCAGEHRPAERDAEPVRRLREAGAIVVGKTNAPEVGQWHFSETEAHGATRNPWHLERTPGGSSGGAAAAVAAGMVPIAHGNDGGGSIRIPAACCGLVGLKPARGRVSVGPDSGHSFLATDGVLTRTVLDTAAVLDVLAGYEPGDATWAAPAPGRYADLVQGGSTAVPPRHIALTLTPALAGATLDPINEAAARDAAALLESLGHDVEEITAPWSGRDLLPDFTRAFGPLTAMGTLIGGRLAGREPVPEDVEPLTWAIWERARSQDALTLLSAQTGLEAVAREIVTGLARFDAVLTPALSLRPVPIGEIHGRGPDPWGHYRRSGSFTPYTAIVNVTGLPAISVPLYHGRDGLPTGVQLIGPPAREELVLALAGQLEQALPWRARTPDV
jgi:amidase